MYANIRKLPGGADPPTLRITFHTDPGTRPQDIGRPETLAHWNNS